MRLPSSNFFIFTPNLVVKYPLHVFSTFDKNTVSSKRSLHLERCEKNSLRITTGKNPSLPVRWLIPMGVNSDERCLTAH
jgi:hypothetical protein